MPFCVNWFSIREVMMVQNNRADLLIFRSADLLVLLNDILNVLAFLDHLSLLNDILNVLAEMCHFRNAIIFIRKSLPSKR